MYVITFTVATTLTTTLAPMTCLPQALAVLDAGARESLADILSKSLAKLAGQPEGKVTPAGKITMTDIWPQDPVLDDTLLA